MFAAEEAEGNVLYWLANLLHWTTEEDFIRRELWFEPGDRVDAETVAEVARNLRGTGLFGAVETELVDLGDGRADVDIATRDRFSLLFSASASLVGGVSKYSGTVGEGNLFGTGKSIRVTASRQDEDDTLAVRYVDPQLLGSWYELAIEGGDTTEGPFGAVSLTRPLQHLRDPWSYGVAASTAERDVDYYSAGDVVASVPQDRQAARAFVSRAFGPRDLRRFVGLDLGASRIAYQPTRGSSPGLVTPPGDTDELQLGVSLGVDWISEFRIEQRIDAIDFDEDVRLGAFANLRAAGAWRDEEGAGDELQPLLELDLRIAASPLEATYTTLQYGGGVRWHGDELLAHRSRVALHVFQKSLPAQTLAASLLFDRVEDLQGLPPQLTLGEDNGLRGYPARGFAGDRYVLLNVEDRIDTGLELWSVHLGLAPFFDIGWIEDPDRGTSMSHPWRAVGIGLRLGSSEFLGRGIIRIDFAFPLDDVEGESLGFSVSAARSQVFGLFGNASELDTEF